jgi:hypothetical protein
MLYPSTSASCHIPHISIALLIAEPNAEPGAVKVETPWRRPAPGRP